MTILDLWRTIPIRERICIPAAVVACPVFFELIARVFS